MKRVNGAPVDGVDGVGQVAALIERVGVNGHLHVVLVGHAQRTVDDGGGRAVVLVHLQGAGTGLDLLAQRAGLAAVALAHEADVDRHHLAGFEHARQIPRPRGCGDCAGAIRGPRATAEESRDPAAERVISLLPGQKMHVGIDGAGGGYEPLARNRLGAGTDHHVGLHAVHEIGIARFADAHNPPVPDADVRLEDAENGIHDDHRGDHEVEHARVIAHAGRLSHAIAEGLATAEYRFIARNEQAALHLADQLGVSQPEAITNSRAIQGGVFLAGNAGHDLRAFFGFPMPLNPPSRARCNAAATVVGVNAPLTRLLKPMMCFLPPYSTSSTSFSSPGSKRVASPPGRFRCMPIAWRRSNSSARLTSKKWKCDPIWMGRSPVLRTFSLHVRRPTLISTGCSQRSHSPGLPMAEPPL